MPSEGILARPEKMMVKTVAVMSGERIIQMMPSAVCLYRTRMSRRARINKSSRYCHNSRRSIQTHPFFGRSAICGSGSAAAGAVAGAGSFAESSTTCKAADAGFSRVAFMIDRGKSAGRYGRACQGGVPSVGCGAIYALQQVGFELQFRALAEDAHGEDK